MEKIFTESIGDRGHLVYLDIKDLMGLLKESRHADIICMESSDMKKSIDRIKPVRDAKGVFINITGPSSIEIKEMLAIIELLGKKVSKKTKIMWGAKIDRHAKHCRVLAVIGR